MFSPLNEEGIKDGERVLLCPRRASRKANAAQQITSVARGRRKDSELARSHKDGEGKRFHHSESCFGAFHSGTQLPALLVKQIDYYFSDDNLVKDDYLKSNMDDQGWVSIDLIAGFRRVKTLTDNIQFILECLGDSTIVEVKGDELRRRGEWMKWVLQFAAPGSFQPCSPSSRVAANCGEQSLATSLQNLKLEGGVSTQGDTEEKVSNAEDSLPQKK